jgi:hypothetical protein
MTTKSRFILIVAATAATTSIASPAFAQPFAEAPGAEVSGSASNRQYLNDGHYSPDFGGRNDQVAVGQSRRDKTAARASGLQAYGMAPRAGTLYDYSPGFAGASSGNSYSPATSGYDPGIETQR